MTACSKKGATAAEAAPSFGITKATRYHWKNTYGGMKAQDSERLKDLELENARLKKIVANRAVNIEMLKT